MSQNDVTGALREAVESIALTQREMGEDIAELATAATELSQATEALTNALAVVGELQRAVEQMGDALTSYTGRLGQLFDQQRDMNDRLGRYISDQAKQDNQVVILRSEVRAIQAGLPKVG